MTIKGLGPLLALLGVYALIAALAPASFHSLGNLETMARQTTIVGIASLCTTLVIMSCGLDLSAALLALTACMACGLLNGLIITRLKVVPFIVTLGTLLLIRGLAKGLAHEQKIDAPMTWLMDLLSAPGPGQRWMLLPVGVWLLVALALCVSGLLRYSAWGRHVVALGSNEQTARLCGINVDRTKLMLYVVSAGFAGLAGIMQFSRLTVGDPTVASGLELDAIAAVVIGGGSLAGGEGSIFGSLMGALIMTVIRSGSSQMGLANWIQEMVTGGIIIIAVALDRYRHRRMAR